MIPTPRSEATDADGTIRLMVNGQPRTVTTGLTVTGLIESLDLTPALIVVEKNLEILNREKYDTTVLTEGDRLELVHFVGGG